MNCNRLSSNQKLALRKIAELEGKIMTVQELEDFLASLGEVFDENWWDFTSQQEEYNEIDDELDPEEIRPVVTEILSMDEVELTGDPTKPYVDRQGRQQYLDGQPLYEIWMTFNGTEEDYELSPSADAEIVITEVEIWVPEELWK